MATISVPLTASRTLTLRYAKEVLPRRLVIRLFVGGSEQSGVPISLRNTLTGEGASVETGPAGGLIPSGTYRIGLGDSVGGRPLSYYSVDGESRTALPPVVTVDRDVTVKFFYG